MSQLQITYKKYLLLLYFLLPGIGAFAQLNNQLTGPGEEVVFAFQLKNKKWVSLCKEKTEKYIVYRMGTQNKVELQYPAVLDSTSWQQFTFMGYSRGGGKQNAAMNVAFLRFTNNDADYEIYETWNAEDDKQQCGITIKTGGKTIDAKGNVKSRKGYLLSMQHNQKIKTEE
ncbi:MAG: hypothetical protein H7X88_07040 [Gloeobacteraceae cyanobacterium ES-bin-316]|nr:hypothetical protein [Ferruginibacter sp.]